jgi:hypothetical protein
MVKLRLVVPLPTQKVLWEQDTRVASNMFGDGFSSPKKCTNEGHALMQLDPRQFLIKLQKLSNLNLPQETLPRMPKIFSISSTDNNVIFHVSNLSQ